MLLTGIDEIVKNGSRLATEIAALAKTRHRDIVR
jgi:hypothetical protein